MLNGVLYNIDANTMVLGLLFVIFFAIINFALNRSLKDKGTAAIIAFCISLLATYGLNRTSLNFSGMFYKIGINDGIIYSVVPIIILIGLIFMIWKVKLGVTLMLTGMGLIILSFFAYKKVLLLIIGIVTIVVGIFFWIRKRRRDKRKGILKVNLLGKKKGNLSSSYGPKRKKRWILWLLFLISFALAFYGVLKGLNTLTLIAGALVLLFGIILFLSRHKKKGNLNPAPNRSAALINEKNKEEFKNREKELERQKEQEKTIVKQKEKEIKKQQEQQREVQQEQAKVMNQQQRIREEIYGLINEGKKIRSRLNITANPKEIERLRRDYEEIIHEINKRRKRL